MSNLAVRKTELPDTLADLTKFVLIGREKLTAVRAQIRAIDKLNLATEVYDQKLSEAQDLAEATLDAEVKIGELTARMEKAAGGDRKSGAFKINSGVDFEKTPKAEQLKKAGLKQHTAERFERLAAHPKEVERAKAQARKEGRIVTRQDAMSSIALSEGVENLSRQSQKNRELKATKERHEAFKESKERGVVDIQAAKADKTDRRTLALEVLKDVQKISGATIALELQGYDRIAEMAAALTAEERSRELMQLAGARKVIKRLTDILSGDG